MREIGLTRLIDLGITDPIYFIGWDMLAELRHEISLLQKHLVSIDFYPELKSQWLSHLIYCYFLLVQTAPLESVPEFIIG